jgi:hypothetical protein
VGESLIRTITNAPRGRVASTERRRQALAQHSNDHRRIDWRAGLVALAAGLSLLVLVIVLTSSGGPDPASAQDAAIEVGAPANGQIGFEVVGQVDQDGANFTGYGYLMYIAGLPDSALYSNPLSRTVATARFTYFATSTISARAVISNLFVLDTTGPLTIYYNESPRGDFRDPSSFACGVPIATNSVRFHDVLKVQAPNLGIANGVAELTQLGATPFVLGGQSYRLGGVGLLQRISVTGQGHRTDAIIPRSISVIAGHSVIVGRRTTAPVILNGSGG